MTLSKQTVYTTTDGQSFPTHKAAKAAQDAIDREARLEALFQEAGFAPDSAGIVWVNATTIAEYGPQFLNSLTLPSGRKPRTPKVAS